jgi:hypothetical protein
MKTILTANARKEEVELNILHNVNGYWVSNEGSKQKPNYHVWIPSVTHSVCDSAYAEIDLAVCRCNYLAKNKIEASYQPLKVTVWVWLVAD